MSSVSGSFSSSGSSRPNSDLRHKDSDSISEYAEQLHAQKRLLSTSEGHLYFIEEGRSSFIFVPNGDFSKAKSIHVFKANDKERKKGFTGADLQREVRVFTVAYNTIIENNDGDLSPYTIIDANNRLVISATGKIKPTLSRLVFEVDRTAVGKVANMNLKIHKWKATDNVGNEIIYDTDFHTYFGHMSTPGKRLKLEDTTWKKIDEIYEKGEVDHKLRGDKVKPTSTSGTSEPGEDDEGFTFERPHRGSTRGESIMPMEEDSRSGSSPRVEELPSDDDRDSGSEPGALRPRLLRPADPGSD